MSLIPTGLAKSGVAAFYTKEVGGSLSFDRATPSYLYRTFGTPSTDGEKCFTISVWVKRAGNTGNNNYIMDGHTANEHVLAFEGDLLRFGAWAGGDQFNLKTNARKLRDTQGWYHIVCAVDTRKAVQQERVIFYINGEELAPQELQGTYPSQNYTGRLNVSGNTAQIGRWGSGTGREFDGYMAEFHFIDAQQQTAGDFGEFKSGVWIPKEYAGTYGNNGFYLDMVSSNFSSPTLSDSSGNSNNWTVSGIGSNDFVLDSCTNNYAVMNNWWPYNSANQNVTYSEGNRKYAMGSSNSRGAATMEVLADGCYFEVLFKSNKGSVGVQSIDGQTRHVWNAVNSGELSNISGTSGATFVDGNIVAIAVGTDGNIKRYLNGALQASDNTLTGYTAGDPLLPLIGEFDTAGSNTAIVNFGQDSTFAGNKTRQGNTDENGQGDFYYTPPTGFVALCTANLPTPAADPASDVEPRDYFETFTYSGNDGGQQIGDVIKKPADTTTISDSLIFNNPTFNNGQYMTRTNQTPDATYTWTISMWFKRGNTNNSTNVGLMSAGSYSSPYEQLYLSSTGEVILRNDGGGSNQGVHSSDRNIADNEWHHVVVSRNGATVAMYLDGVATGTLDTAFNATVGTLNDAGAGQRLGSDERDRYDFDGYMAEVHFIDGTVYDHEDFGNFDANGIWIPKTVTGITYGTNGFYLDFSDNTSTTTLGEDQTANGNDWTLNGFATTDQVLDSPTNSYPTISGTNKNSGTTLSEGNLEFRNTAGQLHNSAIATQRLPKQGKWYWEAKVITDNNPATNAIGIASSSFDNTPTPSGAGNFFYNEGLGWYGNTGGLFGSATYGVEVESGSATTFSNNDIIGVEYDADEKTMYFRKNGTLIDYHYVNINDSAYDFLPATSAYGDLAGNGTRGNIFNFGQKTLYGTDGAGTLPTGFSLLTEDNITVNEDNLESPDWVWVKSRDQARHSGLWDSVRGVRQLLQTSSTDLETDRPGGVVDFNKNGFTLEYDTSWHYNEAGQDEVAWCWKAGTSFSNSAGTNGASIASSGSVNTESGFSITTFTATGSNETVAHGLSAKPDMIIIIRRDDSGSDHTVYHSSLGATKNLRFNNSDEARTDSTFFNDTEPTSSVFTIGGTRFADTNTYVAYCFSGKEGYSKFGTYYESYSSDYNAHSPFAYLGFRPAWILIKSTSTGRAWAIYDNKRTPVNPAYLWLQTSTNTEQSDSTNMDIDFMANGFKIKGGSGLINTTGETYIYAAFAEMPLKYATAR